MQGPFFGTKKALITNNPTYGTAGAREWGSGSGEVSAVETLSEIKFTNNIVRPKHSLFLHVDLNKLQEKVPMEKIASDDVPIKPEEADQYYVYVSVSTRKQGSAIGRTRAGFLPLGEIINKVPEARVPVAEPRGYCC